MVHVPPERASADEPTGRRRRRAWVISAAVHGLVLAWWASLPEPEPEPEPPPPPSPWAAVELIDPSSIAEPVELESSEVVPEEPDEPQVPDELDDADEPDDAPPGSPPPSSDSAERPRSARSPGSTDTEPTTTEIPEPSEPGPSGPGGLALLGLRGSSNADTTRGSIRPSLPPPRVGGGQVMHQVGGSRTEAPSGPRDAAPRSLAEAGFRRTRSGKMVYTERGAGFKATLLPDGRLKFRTTVTPTSMPGMSEIIRAAQGQELFQKQKKRLLEETFELRLRMAVDFARGNLERRLESLYRDLIDQWSDGSSSEAERRAVVFQRWDECEERSFVKLVGFEDAQSSELDQMRREGGAEARRTIERFIRTHLAKGSPQAFTADELRRFNARRRSRARFEPYQ